MIFHTLNILIEPSWSWPSFNVFGIWLSLKIFSFLIYIKKESPVQTSVWHEQMLKCHIYIQIWERDKRLSGVLITCMNLYERHKCLHIFSISQALHKRQCWENGTCCSQVASLYEIILTMLNSSLKCMWNIFESGQVCIFW